MKVYLNQELGPMDHSKCVIFQDLLKKLKVILESKKEVGIFNVCQVGSAISHTVRKSNFMIDVLVQFQPDKLDGNDIQSLIKIIYEEVTKVFSGTQTFKFDYAPVLSEN